MKIILFVVIIVFISSNVLSRDSTKVDRKFSHHLQIGRTYRIQILASQKSSIALRYSLYRKYDDKLHYGIQLGFHEAGWSGWGGIYGYRQNYSALIGLKYYLIKPNKFANFYTKALMGLTYNKESNSYYGDSNKHKIGFATGFYFELVNHLEIGLSVQGFRLNGLLTVGIKI